MSHSRQISVTMIDDHELYRDGLTLYLNMQSDLQILDAVASPMELHRALGANLSDLLLMDINLPQQSGIDLARQILKDHPQLKIIFLTGNESRTYLEQALKAGGRGFVPKSSPKEDILEAIRKVAIGEYFFPSSISQEVFKQFITQLNQANDSSLTEREIEILRCFANGMSFKEIEDDLSISKKTVEHHKKAIFDKLGFTSNADLVKYAIKNHIIEL